MADSTLAAGYGIGLCGAAFYLGGWSGMVAGAVVGGYGGAAVARRLNARAVRVFVIAIGWSMTIYFFVR